MSCELYTEVKQLENVIKIVEKVAREVISICIECTMQVRFMP